MKNYHGNTLSSLLNIIKSPYFFVIWAGLAAFSYFFIDLKLAEYIHAHIGLMLTHIAKMISLLGTGAVYLVGFFILFLAAKFIWHKKELARIGFFLFLTVVVSGIICDVLKIFLGRSRPTELFDHHLFGFYFLQFKSAMWSFPSGHATTITGVMLGLSLLFPRYCLLFLVILLSVCCSRILVGMHFLSDVMMGMYLGAAVVAWLYPRFHWREMSFANAMALPK